MERLKVKTQNHSLKGKTVVLSEYSRPLWEREGVRGLSWSLGDRRS